MKIGNFLEIIYLKTGFENFKHNTRYKFCFSLFHHKPCIYFVLYKFGDNKIIYDENSVKDIKKEIFRFLNFRRIYLP